MNQPKTVIVYMLTRDTGSSVLFYKAHTPLGWKDRFETREAAENAKYWCELAETNNTVKYDVLELELLNPDYFNDI